MDSKGAAVGKPWTPQLTLEDYLNLNNLRVIPSQVLRKKDLMDAASSIQLMEPHHSTLNDKFVSSDAFITLNEVIEDLSDIHRKECCITSIQTVNSTVDFCSKDVDDVAACSSSVTDDGVVEGHRKKKSKPTSKPLEVQESLEIHANPSDLEAQMDQQHVPTQGRPKRKRVIPARYREFAIEENYY